MYNNENRKVRFAETFKQREEIKAEAEQDPEKKLVKKVVKVQINKDFVREKVK
jgi:hypothetical protein